MKRIIALLLIGLLVFSLAACGEKTEEDKKEDTKETVEPTQEVMTTDIGMSEEPVSGGWTDAESPVVTADLKALFDKANATLAGAQYDPVALLGTQVVAGTNYLVLCKETATVPDAVTTYALVTLYEDPQGNAEITDIRNSSVTAPAPYDPENPVSGAYGEPTAPDVPDEAKTALEKACENLDGAAYEPKALLASQVVAGMNYQLLCKVTPIVPDAESDYVIVTVYADLEGGAEITDVSEFESDEIVEDGEPDAEAAEAATSIAE